MLSCNLIKQDWFLFFYHWTINNLSRSHITWANWSFLITMQKKKVWSRKSALCDVTDSTNYKWLFYPAMWWLWLLNPPSGCKQRAKYSVSWRCRKHWWLIHNGWLTAVRATCCSTSFYTSCQLLWMTVSQLDLIIFLACENTSLTAPVKHVQHLISWLFSLS